MSRTQLLSLALTPLWLTACVTINVYFPAAAAEQAADRFIQDVYGKPDAPPEQQQEPAEQQPQSRNRPDSTLATLTSWLIPAAHASANIDIDTPAVQALKAAMQQRQDRLEPYYARGAVGMTADGLITIRDAAQVPLAERNALRRLVAEENRDREALYREIARANGHPEWESDIRATFARRWIANAPQGWWYQGTDGSWKRK